MDDHTSEGAHYFARDFTERMERAAQANVIANQAEVLQRMWQAGADTASTAAARSADQGAGTLGLRDDEAESSAAQVLANVGALVQSASVMTDSVRAISTEFVDLVRHSTARSIDHMAAMMRCRSPQDFVAAHSDTLRENMEMFMDSSRRIAEITLRATEETSHVVGRNLKPIKRAE
jgi:Phasin protein